jgi:hypothetical protein
MDSVRRNSHKACSIIFLTVAARTVTFPMRITFPNVKVAAAALLPPQVTRGLEKRAAVVPEQILPLLRANRHVVLFLL